MPEVSTPEWPSLLPSQPLLDAYDEKHPSLIANVTTGNKSMIIRRVATRSQTQMRVAFNFTKEQLSIFESFFNETLDGGVLRFRAEHPRTKKIVDLSFSPTQQVAYTIQPNGSMNYFKVTADFIVWP